MVKVVIGGDTTLHHLVEPLQKRGYEVSALGFNQWHLEILNRHSQLNLNPPDYLVILLSPRFQEFEPLENLLTHFEGKRGVLFSSLVADPLSPLPLLPAEKNNGALYAFQKEHPWFHVLDMDRFFKLHGIAALHDPRFEVIGRMYFSPGGAVKLADYVARYLHALTHVPKKVLVLDLDNTLWGGILGEEEIQIGQDGIGYAYYLFQQVLLELKQKGILLALCSKNNEADVLEVFQKNPNMLLKLHDFAAFRINWATKLENLHSLSEELRLGLDSFTFFDDSPFEREQLKKLLPQLDLIEVPTDPSYYVEALSNYWGFDALRLTQEDLLRAESYSQEAKRKALQKKSSSLEEFFESLQMEAEIAPLNDSNLERVKQLVHKTNQFNLTTRRYSEDELKRLAVYTLRLRDRLGDSGLTGVIALKKANEEWTIDNLMLSCRIIGRTVEFAFLKAIAASAKREGAKRLVGRFIPSPKNQVAADFYRKAGFTQEREEWILNLEEVDKIPRDYVKTH